MSTRRRARSQSRSRSRSPAEAKKASGGKRKRKAPTPPGPNTMSGRAGLCFPAARVNRYLRTKAVDKDQRVGDTAGVFLAAVLEYLARKILKSSGNIAHKSKRVRISPRHIALAIMNDPELDELVHASIAQGGVMPHIEEALLPKGKKPKDGAPAKKKRKKSGSKSKKKKSSSKKIDKKEEDEEPDSGSGSVTDDEDADWGVGDDEDE